jgi:hypothetical protein
VCRRGVLRRWQCARHGPRTQHRLCSRLHVHGAASAGGSCHHVPCTAVPPLQHGHTLHHCCSCVHVSAAQHTQPPRYALLQPLVHDTRTHTWRAALRPDTTHPHNAPGSPGTLAAAAASLAACTGPHRRRLLTSWWTRPRPSAARPLLLPCCPAAARPLPPWLPVTLLVRLTGRRAGSWRAGE